MNASAARVSAADVTLPTIGAPPNPSAPLPASVPTVVLTIEHVLDGCGTADKNSLLTIAIAALIDAGVNTGPQIVGAAGSLGFNLAHAGAVLHKSQGGVPDRRKWWRGADGRYRNHGDA